MTTGRWRDPLTVKADWFGATDVLCAKAKRQQQDVLCAKAKRQQQDVLCAKAKRQRQDVGHTSFFTGCEGFSFCSSIYCGG
ncbi:hypothetical protein ACQKII_04070 [Lysinibacillus sp. NPDC048646]|uniref:hypothetical protein n=1 Tax=Lysinibacillus sp. NPDC048646 TaxID=3390574 RepID=UPI003CFF2651